jgi:hypothetical protein
MVPRPGHGSAVPSPHCSRLVVTSSSPPHVPLVTSSPTANPYHCTLYIVLTGERGSWEPRWRQARIPELVRRGSLARRGTLLQASRWSELSGCRLHRRLELRLKNESYFPAARFTLLIYLHCCARAAERTARYAAPWKFLRGDPPFISEHEWAGAVAGYMPKRYLPCLCRIFDLWPTSPFHCRQAP